MVKKKDALTDLEIFHSLGESLRDSVFSDEGFSDAGCADGETVAEIETAGEQDHAPDFFASDFMRDLSYDLRIYLTSILGFSALMVQERFGRIEHDRYRRYIGTIHESSACLLDLADDLVLLVETGRRCEGVGGDRFSVGEAIAGILGLLEADAVRFARLLRWDIPVSLFLECDRRVFRRIILNILSPAVRFGGRGGEISLSGRLCSDSGGDWVVIRIRDTHLGLAEKGRNGGDGSQRGFGSGSGLQIGLARALTQALGGRFDLTPIADDGGVLVSVYFPV